jgi:hypothetical protein
MGGKKMNEREKDGREVGGGEESRDCMKRSGKRRADAI